MTPEFRALAEHLDRIAALSPEAIPTLLGELEILRVSLFAQLLVHRMTRTPLEAQETPRPADRLLRPAEAAALLKVTTRWLYRRHRSLPFTRKLSRRLLRFDEAGLHRWLAHRNG